MCPSHAVLCPQVLESKAFHGKREGAVVHPMHGREAA